MGGYILVLHYQNFFKKYIKFFATYDTILIKSIFDGYLCAL